MFRLFLKDKFALKIVELLYGSEKVAKIKTDLVFFDSHY